MDERVDGWMGGWLKQPPGERTVAHSTHVRDWQEQREENKLWCCPHRCGRITCGKQVAQRVNVGPLAVNDHYASIFRHVCS